MTLEGHELCMNDYLEDKIDHIDAALFNGDCFEQNPEWIIRMYYIIDRWQRCLRSKQEHQILWEKERVAKLRAFFTKREEQIDPDKEYDLWQDIKQLLADTN